MAEDKSETQTNSTVPGTTAPVDIDSMKVKLLILCKDQSRLESIVTFLNRRGWEAVITTKIKDALAQLTSIKPDFVLISSNHPNPKIMKFPSILRSSFNTPSIGFSESFDNKSQGLLHSMAVDYKMQGALSGPSTQRRIKQILQEIYSSNSPSSEKKKSLVDGAEDETKLIHSAREKGNKLNPYNTNRNNQESEGGNSSISYMPSQEEESTESGFLLRGQIEKTRDKKNLRKKHYETGLKNEDNDGVNESEEVFDDIENTYDIEDLEKSSAGKTKETTSGGAAEAQVVVDFSNSISDSSGEIDLESELDLESEEAIDSGVELESEIDFETKLDLNADNIIQEGMGAGEAFSPLKSNSLMRPGSRGAESFASSSSIELQVSNTVDNHEEELDEKRNFSKDPDSRSFFEKVVVKIMNQVTVDRNIPEFKISEVERVIIISVQSPRNSGYLIITSSATQKSITEITHDFLDHLRDYLRQEGEMYEFTTPAQVLCEPHDFFDKNNEALEFCNLSNISDGEVAVKYYKTDSVTPKIQKVENTNMYKVSSDVVPINRQTDFKYHVHLEKNKRFIAIVNHGGVLSQNQYEKLKSFENDLYILETDLEKFKRHIKLCRALETIKITSTRIAYADSATKAAA